MSNFKLSLPTDIPWRRICVSSDMIDPFACDDERPPRWHSSLAAFRYDPDEEYQPYDNEVITYIKVVATIAPFQWNEPGVTPVPDFVPQEILNEVEESHPCYGAVLQVTVAPTAVDRDNFARSQYPYFIDFEPKKRELYESVSDTGEILSGSLSQLSVGKAATDTHSSEDYNLDMGGGGGFGLGWGLVQANWSGQEQTGNVTKDAREVQSVRSTDLSTERREVQSHTTQLTQMYNLFQAFHVGTNRAIFFIEPRPHIRQTEATFINGPREIEGIQEVFLIVVRPKAMSDFCVSALLETAHITKEEGPPPAAVTKTDIWQVTFTESAEAGEDDTVTWNPHQLPYALENGWEIIGFTVKNLLCYLGNLPAVWPYTFTPSKADISAVAPAQALAITVQLQKWVREDGDEKELFNTSFTADIEVLLRQTKSQDSDVEYVSRLFMTARELCCCPPSIWVPSDWITIVIDLSRYRWQIYTGPGSPERFVEGRRIAAAIRKEIVSSFGSSQRQARGQLKYTDSDAFHARVRNRLLRSSLRTRLKRPLRELNDFDQSTRESLAQSFGMITVDDLLKSDAAAIARTLNTSLADVGQLKKGLLRRLKEL